MFAFIFVALIGFSTRAFAGYKTGADYEILSDTINKAGADPLTNGGYRLYQSIGQQSGNEYATGSNYSMAGGFLGVADEEPPLVAFLSPASGASIGGVINVLGAVHDCNGVRWTLYYGPGSAPQSWKQIGGASTVASGTLASWDTTNLSGMYTLRVVGVDPRGNVSTGTVSFTVAGNTQTFSSTIQPGKWVMVSLPGAPLNANPKSFLGSTRYEVQRWDPLMTPDPDTNVSYRRDFPVTTGDGFWVKPYHDPITYTSVAWVPDTSQDFTKWLPAGWNQIGAPFNHPIAWNRFRFQRDGDAVDVPMATAIANGWINSSYYDYQDGYHSYNVSGEMQPFAGYFVYLYATGTLKVNPGASLADGMMRIVRPVYDWRLQVAAETDDARDTENYAGEMRGASDGLNPDDSVEPPGVDPYVSLYFPHDDWGKARLFAADIRGPQDAGAKSEKTWTFVVKTDVPGKTVRLSWPDVSGVPDNYQMMIRDSVTGAWFDPKTTPNYSFQMSADKTRTFTMSVRKTAATGNEVALKTTFSAGWKLFSVPLETSDTDVRRQLGNALSKLSIYQYADRVLLDPDSEGRVDIQAGVGYWVYAGNPVDAEFHGRPVADGTPIDVPLWDGWNLIGNPYSSELAYGDNIEVLAGGAPMKWSEAAAAGWIDGRLYRFDTASGGFKPMAAGERLIPWEGYVIKARRECTLRMKP